MQHVYYETAKIIDHTNGIECEIKFNPAFNKGMSGVLYRNTVGWVPGLNGLGKNKSTGKTARADDMDISINSIVKDGDKVEIN